MIKKDTAVKKYSEKEKQKKRPSQSNNSIKHDEEDMLNNEEIMNEIGASAVNSKKMTVQDFLTLNKDNIGAHGYRQNESDRLFSNEDKIPRYYDKAKKDGKRPYLTSEHTILNSILIGGESRGETKISKVLESFGHAYQEFDKNHRAHIGSNKTELDSKDKEKAREYNAYSSEQASLLSKGKTALAIQLNQIYYRGLDSYRDTRKNNEIYNKMADDSFFYSISKKEDYAHLSGEDEVTIVTISPLDKLELAISRLTVILNRVPTNRELRYVVNKYNLTVPAGYLPFINHPEFDDRNIFDITPQISPAKTPLSQEEIQARITAGKKKRSEEKNKKNNNNKKSNSKK
ncbi:hypothetical protein TI10_21170 [Photorhabdus luminescens subsp. luminescens]|uniref:Uncharacterized protein n=1 Tax=Photorhabdus luminescens TaxID=29488 RepID=A0A1G5QA11_PHOLU|nr:hypothetical protein [Photorhabdus luminescens]KMW71385.1 hypothetical protein TI10_21170 [Photorhabdus luminescens subsp. luminescens]SCZ58664.1 hypothetical protein SAMN02982990_01329 [Photorhabdus luminescens]